MVTASDSPALESTSATTTYHRVLVDNISIFYREAGPSSAPTLVLLHDASNIAAVIGLSDASGHYDVYVTAFPGGGDGAPAA